MRRPDAESEERLEAIRRSAAAGNLEKASSYYGLPLLKKPVWTWEIPLYFFVGGAAGVSAVVGFAARLMGANERLIRDARWIAAIGANLSAPLLIADLGRPERFLNMLRVFKSQSPMSVGAWILATFGATSTGAIVLPKPLRDAAAAASAVTGLGMATYTGVLIGATAVPVWAKHVRTLPVLFGASSVGSAVSLLELRGHRSSALNNIGIASSAVETAVGYSIETSKDRVSEPLRGGLVRTAAILSGPIPLFLRLFGKSKRARTAAAISALAGALMTRFAWVEAGKASTKDPQAALGGGHAPGSGQAVRERSPGRQDGHRESDPGGQK